MEGEIRSVLMGMDRSGGRETWETPFGNIPLVAILKGRAWRCQLGACDGLSRDLKSKV